MGFEIVWTKKAVKTFSNRIAYLEENWTQKEIFNFTARVNKYLESLQNQPLMFRKSTKINDTNIGVIIKTGFLSLSGEAQKSENRINRFC